ncbi:MAG: DHH family phosphoesterase [Deltaproteobacteria bacterium]|nr:DHH family phosphoesterase [Deltaproteobacteria bacterium]
MQRASASGSAARLRDALGLTHSVASVLAARGHDDPARTRRWLDLRLADLTPPERMIDRDAASERVADAVRRKERVIVCGDYDVDGITSAAVVTSAIRALGGDATPLLASRFDGGYGFSDRALQRVLEAKPTLVVTCDCGSSDHPRLDALRRAGIDAVVIDHHLVPPEPLPVVAFLNPHRPECGFPFKGLASCGLALSLAAAVRARLAAALDLRPLLDLVALGTVADVAPLEEDNRALVKAGLVRIATAPRAGIEALAEVAGVKPGAAISGEDIGFRFAPRINAPGRLGSPDPSLQLLLASDRDEARALAGKLEQDTRARREIERKIFDAAVQQVGETGQIERPSIVVAADGWNVGVVGIVAARLVERFGVPVIAIGLDGAEGRGSVRGPEGSRLYDALSRCREALVGFGGHQAAAGVHVAAREVERLRDLFAQACGDLASVDPGLGEAGRGSHVRGRVATAFEAALDPRDDLWSVIVDLERLEPCGERNRAPTFGVVGAEVLSARAMKGEHLRLALSWEGRALEAFGYGLAREAPQVRSRIDLIGQLRRDDYRGRGAVELRIGAIRPRPTG